MKIYKFPWPPTINNYWAQIYGRVLLSKKGRIYRSEIIKQILIQGKLKLTGNIKVSVKMYPPDNRKRDIDNPVKCLLDSMQHGGLFDDDNQIKKLDLEMMPEKGGFVEVYLTKLDD